MQKLDFGTYAGAISTMNGENGILASITTYDTSHFYKELHYHDHTHFGFTIGGELLERKTANFSVLPGKITHYRAGEPHQTLQVVKPSLRVNLEIDNTFLKQFDISEDMVEAAADKNPDTKFLMLKMFKELLIGDTLIGTTNQMLFLQIVHQTKHSENASKRPLWVGTVSDYLRENIDSKISLDDLALIAGVHPITISKHFSRYFNCTLGEYVRKLRIEKSLALIKSSNLSLTDLAYECGFFDQSHFTRSFKELVGFLPKRYKALPK